MITNINKKNQTIDTLVEQIMELQEKVKNVQTTGTSNEKDNVLVIIDKAVKSGNDCVVDCTIVNTQIRYTNIQCWNGVLKQGDMAMLKVSSDQRPYVISFANNDAASAGGKVQPHGHQGTQDGGYLPIFKGTF